MSSVRNTGGRLFISGVLAAVREAMRRQPVVRTHDAADVNAVVSVTSTVATPQLLGRLNNRTTAMRKRTMK